MKNNCAILNNMSEKTSQILQNLKSITQKEPVEENTSGPIASNLDNDRIYSNLHNDIHLINRDGSKHKGKIFKRRITLKDIDGGNFFAHAYETDDGRWFDRGGLPCARPKILAKQSDTEVDSVDNTAE